MKKCLLMIVLAIGWLVGFISLAHTIVGSEQLKVNHRDGLVAIIGMLGFYVIFAIGNGLWAKDKGYHFLIGLATGLVNPLGLLVVVLLPDKAMKGAPQ